MAEPEFKPASELPWTAADQARVDSFEAYILEIADRFADQPDVHPDVMVNTFTQLLGTLMRRRLQAEPARLATYARMLEMLEKHVKSSVLPDTVKH